MDPLVSASILVVHFMNLVLGLFCESHAKQKYVGVFLLPA